MDKYDIEKLADKIYEYIFPKPPISKRPPPRPKITVGKGTTGQAYFNFELFSKIINDMGEEAAIKFVDEHGGMYMYSGPLWESLSDEQKAHYEALAREVRKGNIAISGALTNRGKLTMLVKQSINDAKKHGTKILESLGKDEDASAHIENVVTSMIDYIVKQMDLKEEYKIRLIESLYVDLRPVLYKAIGKTAMFEKELGQMAPTIILQPGSRWVKAAAESYGQFSKPPPKEVYRGVVRDITKGRKKYYQAWRSFCSQTDELGKAELIQLAKEMELPPYIQITPRSQPRSWDKMTKKEICDFLQKYFAQTVLND